MAPDGTSLLTLDAPSVQTALDGYRRIVWMIKRMIKGIRQRIDAKASKRAPRLRDDQGASDTKSDAQGEQLLWSCRRIRLKRLAEGLSVAVGLLGLRRR